MPEAQYIADEVRCAVEGPAWHGPALMEMLEDVTPEEADARPIPEAHTIHELILHLSEWQRLATRAMGGKTMPKWPFPEDWREPQPGGWPAALDELRATGAALGATAERLQDAALDRIVPGREFTLRYLLHGIAQHACYHGGQIALIRKLLRRNP